MFNPVDPKQNFPELEKEILDYWKENETFQKSVTQRSTENEYVFYDGPPFATGLPHYGHLLAGTMKDVVPRYWTMRGKRVERRFGWDCHGLPIEYEVEKELELSGRKDIEEKIGVEEFCEKCRSVVTRYTSEWRETVERMGRWVDMDNDYKTMDPDFMESIWWVFGQLWQKGLVYEGYKSMHICPRCVTPLSNFEVTQGYKDVTDTAVFWKFELMDRPKTTLLAWTTTPWSTLGTMGLAVGADHTYVQVKVGEESLIFAKDRLEVVLKGIEEFTIEKEFKGTELVGKSYQPLADHYRNHPEVRAVEGVYRVYATDYVEVNEGTGIVTINGAYGEIDMTAAKANGLPIVMDVDMDGTFNEIAGNYKGMTVQEVTKALIKDMTQEGKVWRSEPYRHSYPHCWRCDSALLNYATSSWFVKVEDIKQKMLDSNAQVRWVPEHVGQGRFRDWLENARDWCISRNRFWGTPLPIWRNEDGDVHVIGSVKELEELTGQTVNDLHKHRIDDLTFEKDGKTYRRIPEVFDCWFESGAMPYAQMHYPFENREKFEKNFPAEYIAEGLDQTRGWFYTLVVLGVGLFGTAPFKNVVVNGLLLAEDGKKMSKRLKNYPDPTLIFDKYGADALRFYLMNSPAVKAEPLCFSEKGVESVVKGVILPVWNAYSFFVTYANLDGWTPTSLKKSQLLNRSNKMDRWILSELHTLLKEVTQEMDAYNLQAIRPIYTFIDQLTNWYIRRSRRRFWKNDDDHDKREGYETLYTVLATLSQIMAPVMPFLSESMYRNLTGGESVHLTDWPAFDDDFIYEDLNKEVELTQSLATLGNAARARAKVKNRQPLAKVSIGLPANLRTRFPEDQQEVVREELNVKELELVEDPSTIAKPVIQPNAKLLGPKVGKDLQFLINEARAGNVELLENGNAQIGTFTLSPEEFTLGYQGGDDLDVESDNGMVVALSTRLTPELKQEGIARDLIRHIQDLRKEAGYNVEDRIRLTFTSTTPESLEAFENFKELIAAETLATECEQGEIKTADLEKEVEGGRIGIKK